MYSEEQSTGKFHKWAVWSYVFAVVSALGLTVSVVEWIFWKKGAMLTVSNAIWRLAQCNSSTKFHIIMAVVVVLFGVGVFTNVFGARLMGRTEKPADGSCIFTAVTDIAGGLIWAAVAVFALIDGIGAYDKTYQWIAVGIGGFGILTLVAMIVSALFLFKRGNSVEEEDYSFGQMGNISPLPPMGGAITPGAQPMGQPPVGGATVPGPQPMGQPPMGGAIASNLQPMEQIQPDQIFGGDLQLKQIQPKKQMGRVRVTRGTVVGTNGYRLPETNKIVIGKNPQKCSLILSNPHISNIHCSVRYNAGRNTYIVIDHSSNGTYVNQNRLPKDQAVEYPAGTVLLLASADTQVTLG